MRVHFQETEIVGKVKNSIRRESGKT